MSEMQALSRSNVALKVGPAEHRRVHVLEHSRYKLQNGARAWKDNVDTFLNKQ